MGNNPKRIRFTPGVPIGLGADMPHEHYIHVWRIHTDETTSLFFLRNTCQRPHPSTSGYRNLLWLLLEVRDTGEIARLVVGLIARYYTHGHTSAARRSSGQNIMLGSRDFGVADLERKMRDC